MNFWERVDKLLEEKEINRKTLAAEAHFDASNVTKGIKNGNIPAADTAVKIARILNVSVEYLVDGTEKNYTQNELKVFADFKKVIDDLKELPREIQENLFETIHSIRKQL